MPRALGECLSGKDRAGAQRAMEPMLGMGKLDVKALKAAYRGKEGPLHAPVESGTGAYARRAAGCPGVRYAE